LSVEIVSEKHLGKMSGRIADLAGMSCVRNIFAMALVNVSFVESLF